MSGLVTMTPTSIDHVGTSASINANGGVDFEGVTSLSLNGVFKGGDDGFDNYVVMLSGTVSAGGAYVAHRYLSQGLPALGSDYTYEYLEAEGGNVTSVRTSKDHARFAGFNAPLIQGVTLNLYGPSLGSPTAWRSVTHNSYGSAAISDYAGTHSLSESYDGLTIFPASSTITGNVIVMGYAE